MYSDGNFEIRREYQKEVPSYRFATEDEDLEAFAEIGGFFLQVFVYKSQEQGESNADTKPMAYRTFDYAGEFPADGSLSGGGPDWLSRKDIVFGAEIPSRCSGERFRIPAGRTARVYRAENGRTSLD